MKKFYDNTPPEVITVCTHKLKDKVIMVILSEKEQMDRFMRKIGKTWIEAMKESGFSDKQIELFKNELKKRDICFKN